MALKDLLTRLKTRLKTPTSPGATLPTPGFLAKPVEKIREHLAKAPIGKLAEGKFKEAWGKFGEQKMSRQEVMDVAMSFVPGAIASVKKVIQPVANVAKQSVKESLEVLAKKRMIPTPPLHKPIEGFIKDADVIGKSLKEREVFFKIKSTEALEQRLGQSISAGENNAIKLELENRAKKPLAQINTRTFKVSEEAKKVLGTEIDEMKELIAQKTGQRLSNQEVKDYAKNTSQILKRGVDREATRKWESAVYNLRTTLAEQAESGKVTQEFIDNIVALKSAGTDVARKLQSLGIEAAPGKGNQQALIEAILDSGAKADEVIKAAEGVNFNNYNESVNFYRQFVKPKMGEWIDLVRYNSMLSSPLTHIVNTASNLLGSALIKPLTKEVAGVIDFIGAKVSGRAQKNFSGEGLRYVQGFVRGINKAFNESLDVMQGKKTFEALDIERIAPAVKGVKGVIAKGLSFPLRGLEAAYRFFTVF